MSSKTVTLSSKLSEVVSRYPNQSTDNGKVLFCKIYDYILKYDVHHRNHSIKMHLKTDKHKNTLKIKEKSMFAKQVIIENIFESANKSKSKFDQFLSDLTEMMVKCDIPLNKVNGSIFKEFMHKYTRHNIPERKALDKYISSYMIIQLKKLKKLHSGSISSQTSNLVH
jgi:signal recognition particle GTPase